MKSFADKSPTNSTQAEILDAAWSAKAPGWRKEGRPQQFFERFYTEHKAELGSDVLDVGCGPGIYTVRMAKDGFKVVGVDINREMRSRAEKALQQSGLQTQAQIVEGKSTQLDFPDTSFDFVVSTGAIHHNMWIDIEKSFAEVARVLKPGKFFLFQGRSINDSAKVRRRIIDTGYTAVDLKGDKQGVIQHYFTLQELEELAIENGLEIFVKPKEELETDKANPNKKRARWWVVYQKI